MLRFAKLSPLLLLSLILTTQCVFEPDGENLVPIPMLDLSSVSINLNDYASDTIYLDATKQFTFNVSGLRAEPDSFRVYINNRFYTSGIPSAGGNCNFNLSSLYTGTGYHTLRIESVAPSGTNSLGDQAGVEKVSVWREWMLDADATKPEPIPFTFDTLHGTVTLNWQPYHHRTFKKYKIFKECKRHGASFPSICSTIEISDPNQTSWTDTQYMGEPTTYWVEIIASDWQVPGPQQEMNFNPWIRYEFIDNRVKLSWQNIFFYKNVSSISIRKNNVPEITFTNLPVSEHTMLNTFDFGYDYDDYEDRGFKVILEGANQIVVYTTDVFVGKKINVGVNPVFGIYLSSLAYVPSEKKYIGKVAIDNQFSFASFDTTLTLLEKANYSPSQIGYSNSREHIYAQIYSPDQAIASKVYISLIDAKTLVPQTLLSLKDKTNITRYPEIISVTDNNLIVFNSNWGNLIYSQPSNEWIFTKYYNINLSLRKAFSVSKDGRYIYEDNKLYQVTNNIATEVKTYLTTAMRVMFRPDKTNELMFIQRNGDILIENVENFTARTITLASNLINLESVSYDPISGYLALSMKYGSPFVNYMIHLDTGTSFTVKGLAPLTVANNNVFSSAYYIEIDKLKAMSTL